MNNLNNRCRPMHTDRCRPMCKQRCRQHDVYFCDPHSPWQRPSNENTNGLIRQYFPKRSDLRLHDQTVLDQTATELNQRPRLVLDDRTPEEVLTDFLRHDQTLTFATTG